MNNNALNSNYKWIILTLGGLTNAIVVAVPGMSLSVLIPEISTELNLSLVQAGLVWGISSLPIVFSGIYAGILSDRLGPKLTILIGCLMSGLIGASRGLSSNFYVLLITVFSLGLFTPLITISNVKNVGIWFPENQVGMANGFLGLGMALGFFIGANLSASYVSPWVGGWRNVFFLYGLLALSLMIPWLISQSAPETQLSDDHHEAISTLQFIKHIIRIRDIWLIGLAFLTITGAVQGLLGYLPLYLRNLGWQGINADRATSFFHLASMVCIIPLTLISDRIGSSKQITLIATTVTALSIGSLFIADDWMIWTVVIIAGLSRDSLMALLITMVLRTKGVGTAYAGIATGFTIIFAGIGSLLSPPFGNRLASNSPSTPFIFWGTLCALGVICIALTRREKVGSKSTQITL